MARRSNGIDPVKHDSDMSEIRRRLVEEGLNLDEIMTQAVVENWGPVRLVILLEKITGVNISDKTAYRWLYNTGNRMRNDRRTGKPKCVVQHTPIFRLPLNHPRRTDVDVYSVRLKKLNEGPSPVDPVTLLLDPRLKLVAWRGSPFVSETAAAGFLICETLKTPYLLLYSDEPFDEEPEGGELDRLPTHYKSRDQNGRVVRCIVKSVATPLTGPWIASCKSLLDIGARFGYESVRQTVRPWGTVLSVNDTEVAFISHDKQNILYFGPVTDDNIIDSTAEWITRFGIDANEMKVIEHIERRGLGWTTKSTSMTLGQLRMNAKD